MHTGGGGGGGFLVMIKSAALTRKAVENPPVLATGGDGFQRVQLAVHPVQALVGEVHHYVMGPYNILLDQHPPL